MVSVYNPEPFSMLKDTTTSICARQTLILEISGDQMHLRWAKFDDNYSAPATSPGRELRLFSSLSNIDTNLCTPDCDIG